MSPFWAFVVFVVCSLALSLGARLASLVRVPACAATTGWSRLCRPLFCVLCRAFFVFCLVSCCCPCCVRLVYVAFLCCRWSRLFGAFVAFSFACFVCCFSFLSSAALSSFVLTGGVVAVFSPFRSFVLCAVVAFFALSVVHFCRLRSLDDTARNNFEPWRKVWTSWLGLL